MLNLLAKDFKLLFFSDRNNIKRQILSMIFGLLLLLAVLFIEIYIFTMVIEKVKIYPGACNTFLILFLFIVSCAMIVLNISTVHKLLFNEKDIEQLTHYPISNDQIILSKLLFIFGIHYVTSLLFTFPLFVAYGQIVGRTPMFYFICLFYPVLTFLFEGGIALLLVYPYKLILDYLKKHMVLQFIIAVILMSSLCYLYSKVLTIFMDLVVTNNLNSLFTTESIANITKVTNNMIPINFLAKYFLGITGKIVPYYLMSIGVFILGLTVSIFAFNYFRTIKFNSKPKELKSSLRVRGVNEILIKKELSLLFKDSNNILSFTGLLIIQPILMYLVIKSLTGVFTSGSFQYYTLVIPQFVPLLDIVLIMLFTLIINSGANNYISSEKNTMKIMKTIPVHYNKQLFIKVAVPFTASLISLIISTLVLLFTNIISFKTFIFAVILSGVLLLVFEFVSLKEELNIRLNKPRSTFISSMYSYLLPIVFFVVALIACTLNFPIVISYLIGLATIVLLGLPFIISIKRNTSSLFMDLEVVN